MRVRKLPLPKEARKSGPPPPFRYWAFISYSQQDKRWGEWVHRRLETYRLPRKVENETGSRLPERLAPVFLDREELASSASLRESIRKALEQSMYLIVVCSPRAAASHWVNQEVQTFHQLGRGDRILCFIIEGEPNAGRSSATEPECLPEAIRSASAHPIGVAEPGELLAADGRESKDGRRRALLKLVAAILQIPFDLLWDRERRRRGVRRLQLAGLISAALVIVGVLTTSWYIQRRVALMNLRQREQQTIREQLLGGDVAAAVALLSSILSSDGGRGDGSPFELLFRFWQPALRPLNEVIGPVRDGSIVSWNGRSYVVVGRKIVMLPHQVALAGTDRARRQLFTISPEGRVHFWSFPEILPVYTFEVDGVDLTGAFRAPRSSILVLEGNRQSSYAGGATPVFVIIDPGTHRFRSVATPWSFRISPGCRELLYENPESEAEEVETLSIALHPDSTGRFPSPQRHAGPLEGEELPESAGCVQLAVFSAPSAFERDLDIPPLHFPDLVPEMRQWKIAPVHTASREELADSAEYDELSWFAGSLRPNASFEYDLKLVRWEYRFEVDKVTVVVGRTSEGAQFGGKTFCATEDGKTAIRCERYIFHGDGGALAFAPGHRYVLIQNMNYMDFPAFDVLRLPDLETVTPATTPPGWGPTEFTAAFNPASSKLAVVAEDGELWLYQQTDQGFELRRRQTLPGTSFRIDRQSPLPSAMPISTIRFSDSSTLLVARGREIWALDSETGDLLWRNTVEDLGDGPIYITVSPFDQLFAAYSPERLRLYESNSGSPLTQMLAFHGSVRRRSAADLYEEEAVPPYVEFDPKGGLRVVFPDQIYQRRPPLAPAEVENALRGIQSRTGIDPQNGRSTLALLPGALIRY